MRRPLVLACFGFSLALSAGAKDCPCPDEKPKPKPAKSVSTWNTPKAPSHAPVPGPPGPQGPAGPEGPQGPKGDKGDPGAVVTIPPPPEPEYKARPLAGGGVSYGQEHHLDWHIFTGVQFPADHRGGNWQLQIGGAFEKRDDASCVIKCWDCKVPGGTDERAVVSGVYVF